MTSFMYSKYHICPLYQGGNLFSYLPLDWPTLDYSLQRLL